MYPGSLPLISNGSMPGHEKLFNVHRCSMYTGFQFGKFHCTYPQAYIPTDRHLLYIYTDDNDT